MEIVFRGVDGEAELLEPGVRHLGHRLGSVEHRGVRLVPVGGELKIGVFVLKAGLFSKLSFPGSFLMPAARLGPVLQTLSGNCLFRVVLFSMVLLLLLLLL